MNEKYDLLIIGGGPAGYTAAIHAGNAGLKTALIEKSYLGGTCLNVGCIPTKALIRAAEIAILSKDSGRYGISTSLDNIDFKRACEFAFNGVNQLKRGVEFLLKKSNIEIINGLARFSSSASVSISGDDGNETGDVSADNILIATGSKPHLLKNIPHDGKKVLVSHDIFSLKELPRSITIFGGGAIGVEFAYICNSLGVETAVIELQEHLLPTIDKEISIQLERNFAKSGITVKTGASVEEIKKTNENVTVYLNQRGKEEIRTSECILSAAGRTPQLDNLDLDRAEITLEDGFINVNNSLQTNISHIYAAGDVINTPMLAHTASEEGIAAVQSILGKTHSINYNNVPFATYNHPQTAGCGYTEGQARELGLDIAIGKAFFKANGMAAATGKTEGLVKVICSKKDRRIIGAYIIGESADELIHEIILARNNNLTTDDVAKCIHAHPSLSESVREACRNIRE